MTAADTYPVVAVIDFKSVGERDSLSKFQPVENVVPVGIMTPLRLGSRHDGIFAMHTNVADQIQDNFRNLIMTNHGERLGRYDFGANIRELSLEYGQDAFDGEAISRIRGAIERYMPFISPRTFESQPTAARGGMIERVDIKITYDVPRLGIVGKEIQVTIFVRG